MMHESYGFVQGELVGTHVGPPAAEAAEPCRDVAPAGGEVLIECGKYELGDDQVARTQGFPSHHTDRG